MTDMKEFEQYQLEEQTRFGFQEQNQGQDFKSISNILQTNKIINIGNKIVLNPKGFIEIDIRQQVAPRANIAIKTFNIQSQSQKESNYYQSLKTYIVNTATPATLLDYNGESLKLNRQYLLEAWVSGTGTRTGARTIISSDGTNFELVKLYEAGKTSNHIEFYLDTNVPKVRLYNHNDLYGVNVFVTELNSTSSSNRGYPWGDIPLNRKIKFLNFTATGTIAGAGPYTHTIDFTLSGFSGNPIVVMGKVYANATSDTEIALGDTAVVSGAVSYGTDRMIYNGAAIKSSKSSGSTPTSITVDMTSATNLRVVLTYAVSPGTAAISECDLVLIDGQI